MCGEDAIRMPAHRSVVAALPSAITATGSNSSLNANKGVTIDFQKAEKIDERGVEDFRSSRSDPEQVHNPKLIQGIEFSVVHAPVPADLVLRFDWNAGMDSGLMQADAAGVERYTTSSNILRRGFRPQMSRLATWARSRMVSSKRRAP